MEREYLVSASEMRRYDENTIKKIGISADVLMERAALGAVRMIEEHDTAGRRVLIMAGMGNNGGDGLAAARLLAEKGYRTEVWCVGAQEKASEQWKKQRKILGNYPVEFTNMPKRQEYDVLVDALFGVGLSREVTGDFAKAVELFNHLDGWKLAMDLPSGIDSDTGRVWGLAVQADETAVFGFCKRGLVLYPGCEYAGIVKTVDIGISERSFFGGEPEMYTYRGTAAKLLPKRKRDGNKGTFGKVLLAAGSLNMAGAAVLAARAAYRAGAGMVKVITPAENRIILQEAVPEALLGTAENLEEGMAWANVIAIGPGLGKSEAALSALERVLLKSGKPLLIDADGLNLLAEHPELRKALADQGKEGRAVILTPHVGELARLVGTDIDQCSQNIPFYGSKLAAELHATVAAKDARTFVCGEGRPIYVNVSGNSGMASAGSGDVLAGVITAFLAQGMEAFEAAAAGVYIHGTAGDAVAARLGEFACMAGDIAEQAGICCSI